MRHGTILMSDETEDDRMRRLITDRVERPMAKRFYKDVSVSSENAILLDQRAIKTPLKAHLKAPSRHLADHIAKEWAAQDNVINPATMILTKLANTAIDRTPVERTKMLDELVDYTNADLVCYRADTPATLVEKQIEVWDPVLDWAKTNVRADFVTSIGVVHRQQSEEALANMRRWFADHDDWTLTAVYQLTTLLGSALLTAMLLDHSLTADAAWRAAHVDEDFQIEQWGWDTEAQTRRAGRKREFERTVLFLETLAEQRLP